MTQEHEITKKVITLVCIYILYWINILVIQTVICNNY